jgi:hypothetical protein
LMVLCPAAVALILAGREHGWAGVLGMAGRLLDFSRVRGAKWYVVTLVTMPLIATAAFGVMRVLGRDLPQLEIPWSAVPGMSFMILVAAAAWRLSLCATPR